MKKFLFRVILFLLVLFSNTAFSQLPFTRIYIYDQLQSSTITKSFDKNYLITAHDYGLNNYLIKIDSAGNALWTKQYANVASDMHIELVPLSDSGYMLVSSDYDLDLGYYNLVCIKTDQYGDTIRTKTYDFNHGYQPYSACQSFDQGLLITGTINFGESPKKRLAITKTDGSGNHSWTKVLSGGNHANYGYAIKQLPDSNFVLTGFIEDSDPFTASAVVLKFTEVGNILWSKKYTVESTDFFIACEIIPVNNGLLIGGRASDKLVLIKTDFDGQINWSKSYDIYSFNELNNPRIKIISLENGHIAVLSPDFLVKTDSTGNVSWATGMVMYISDVIESNDHGFMVIGNGPVYGVKSPGTGLPHIGLIKTDSTGFNDAYCVWQDEIIATTELSITQEDMEFNISNATGTVVSNPVNTSDITLSIEDECVTFIGQVDDDPKHNSIRIYPNPASRQVTIQLTGNVQLGNLMIYSADGKPVIAKEKVVLTDLQIDVSGLPAGIYTVRIATEAGMHTSKLLVY